MTRFQKRSLMAGLLLLAAALASVMLFQMSSRAALRRAEAFLFRRMQVTRLDEETYRYFYATNRAEGRRDGGLEERFVNQREPGLRFGSFAARVDPTIGHRSLFDPSKWFRNEEILIREEHELGRADFIEQLRELVQDSPHRSLLVVVHGYREQFASALRKTAFMSHLLDIDTPVLVFDWPGDQSGSPIAAYRSAVGIAEASGAELALALELIVREIAPGKLWVIANSMGGQVVADAFGILYQQPDFADAPPEFEDVVLTAPDVALDEFDRRFQQEITALTRHLTVYVSSNDRALLASRIVNRGPRRGESTLDSRDVSQGQLDEAIRLAALVEPDSDLISLVDVTPVNRTLNFHNFYLESVEVYNDLYLRLINSDTPSNRLLYPIRSREGSTYWVLTRGR